MVLGLFWSGDVKIESHNKSWMDILETRDYSRRDLVLEIALVLTGLMTRALAIFNTNKFSNLGMPLSDDSYYYFSLGRNIASGKGFRVDPLHLTTGFQPLWGFIVAIPYLFFGGFTSPISVIQAIGMVSGVISGVIIYRVVIKLCKSWKLGLLISIFWTFSPQAIKHNVNGMETSVANMFALIIVYFLLSNLPNKSLSLKHYIIAGLLTGLAIMSRFDLVILYLSVAILVLFVYRGVILSILDKKTIVCVSIYTAALIISFIPWFVVIIQANGSIIPESGEAVRTISLLTDKLPKVGFVASILDFPAIFLPYYSKNILVFTASWMRQVPWILPVALPIYAIDSTTIAPSCMFVISLILNVFVAWRGWLSDNRLTKVAVAAWGVYLIGMTVAYSSIVLGQWFYDRYGTPLAIFFTIILGLVVYETLPLRRWVFQAYAPVIMASFVFLLVFGSYSWMIRGPSVVPSDGFYDAALWINHHVEKPVSVGSFQSGLIGYYADPKVINLDGKVNNDAKRARDIGQMWNYVCGNSIDFIVDWESQINQSLINRSFEGQWSNDNLMLEKEIRPTNTGNPILIYKVNEGNCLEQGVRLDRQVE